MGVEPEGAGSASDRARLEPEGEGPASDRARLEPEGAGPASDRARVAEGAGPASERTPAESEPEGARPTSDRPPAKPGAEPARGGDYRNILSGTSQNVIGVAIAAVALFAAQVLISHRLGPAGFGVVTVVTQAAFVISFGTRFGMDMAVLRNVAIEVGAGRPERVRATVARAIAVATAVSTGVAFLVVIGSGSVRDLFSIEAEGRIVVVVAALGLPFLAIANVWLAATRGLKIMRYTLYVFWAGQPIVWIVLMLIGWAFSESTWMAALAYSLSWVWAAAAAGYFWKRESRSWPTKALEPGDGEALLRYAAPRAPAALFSQLLFWTDLFVLTRYVSDASIGVYSAALRAGQVVVLFLTSVNLMFSPYVADLHSRGETDRLDELFKTLTRWTIAATLPVFLLIAVAPESVLRLFGAEFAAGEAALLILLAGQFVNICTGSVGFVLIMAGRTGWDLVVYAGSLALDLGLAVWLASRHGLVGAAVANAITFGVSNGIRLLLVKRFVGIQPYDARYLRLLVPAAASGAVMWGVHAGLSVGWLADLVLTGGAGAIAYVVAYLIAGLTPEERRGGRVLVGRTRGG